MVIDQVPELNLILDKIFPIRQNIIISFLWNYHFHVVQSVFIDKPIISILLYHFLDFLTSVLQFQTIKL